MQSLHYCSSSSMLASKRKFGILVANELYKGSWIELGKLPKKKVWVFLGSQVITTVVLHMNFTKTWIQAYEAHVTHSSFRSYHVVSKEIIKQPIIFKDFSRLPVVRGNALRPHSDQSFQSEPIDCHTQWIVRNLRSTRIWHCKSKLHWN